MAAAVVSGAAADVLQKHPNWTPNQVKWALKTQGGPLSGSNARELKVAGAVGLTDDKLGSANAGLTPSTLVDPATGDVDPARASWRRASWRDAAGSGLGAGWAAASWRCDCSLEADGSVSPTAASWRAASWRRTTDFAK
jgi:subtilisin family serine protease